MRTVFWFVVLNGLAVNQAAAETLIKQSEKSTTQIGHHNTVIYNGISEDKLIELNKVNLEKAQKTVEERKDATNDLFSSLAQTEKIIGVIIFLVFVLGIFKFTNVLARSNKRKQEENEQDKRNLISILESINTSDIETIIYYAEGGMPQLCINLISYYDITLEGLIKTSTFHFYNSELEKVIIDFYTFLGLLYSHHSEFKDTANNHLLRFPKHYEPGWNEIKLKNYEKKFRSDVGKLKTAWEKLINYVIDNYPDINRQATNSKAIAARKKLDNYFA